MPQHPSVVRTLVLPVAGMGTRLHPLTLTIPKPLVKLREKPLLRYMIEEARENNISRVVIVASPEHENAITDYIKEESKIFPQIKIYVRFQKQPFGNGDAILEAGDIVGGEPFAVRFCDDIFLGEGGGLRPLLRAFKRDGVPVLSLKRSSVSDLGRYGAISAEPGYFPNMHRIVRIAEKPTPEEIRDASPAFLPLGVLGAYVASPSLMGHLGRLRMRMPMIKDGLPWTAVFHEELRQGGRVHGIESLGVRLDCGTLSGLKEAERILDTLRGAVRKQ